MGNNVSLEVPKLLGELATVVAMQVNEIAHEFGCETGSTYVIKKGRSAGQDSGTCGKFLEQCVSIREWVGSQNDAEGTNFWTGRAGFEGEAENPNDKTGQFAKC